MYHCQHSVYYVYNIKFKAVEDHITLLTKQNSFKFYRTDLLQLMLDAKADDYVADEVLTMTADPENEGINIEEMASSETSDKNKSCNAASARGHGIGRKKLTTQVTYTLFICYNKVDGVHIVEDVREP